MTSDETVDGVEAELVHDARQRDREHRRVERHEHGAAGHPEHRRAERAAPGRGAAVTGGARSRCSPSISTSRPSAIRVVASPVPTTAGSAELAGDDGRVRQDAAGVGDQAAGDREQRHPRRVRRRADDDVAGLDRPEVVLRERHPGRTAHDSRRGAGPAELVRARSTRSARRRSGRRRRRPRSGGLPTLGRRADARQRAMLGRCARRRGRARSLGPAQSGRRPRRDGGRGRRRARDDPAAASRAADAHRRSGAGTPAPSGRSSSCAPRSAGRSGGRRRAGPRTRASRSGSSARRARTPVGEHVGLGRQPLATLLGADRRRVLDPLARARPGAGRAPRPTTAGRGRRTSGRDGRARRGRRRGRRRTARPPASAASSLDG